VSVGVTSHFALGLGNKLGVVEWRLAVFAAKFFSQWREAILM